MNLSCHAPSSYMYIYTPRRPAFAPPSAQLLRATVHLWHPTEVHLVCLDPTQKLRLPGKGGVQQSEVDVKR